MITHKTLIVSFALLAGMRIASASVPAAALDAPLLAEIPAVAASSTEAKRSLPIIVQARVSVTPAMQARFRSLGGHLSNLLPIIHGFSGTIPAGALQTLSSEPWVKHVSADVQLKKQDDTADPAVGSNIANTAYGFAGAGVTVAVLDSGILPVLDLYAGKTSRVIAGPNFSTDTSPYDLCGHGTHVAGLIGGNGACSTGAFFSHTFTGVAPQCTLLSVKILNSQGQGSTAAAINGIGWCIANKSKYNIRALNLSIGHPVTESYQVDPLCQAVEQAWQSGIVVVCAAGNFGRSNPGDKTSPPTYGTICSPGNDPSVITVGATNTTDGPGGAQVMASYSSHGPTLVDNILKPDVVAPGNRLISLEVPGGKLISLSNGNVVPLNYYVKLLPKLTLPTPAYYTLSGTSMAAGVVSGAVALMLQKDPTLMPDTVKGRLMKTARHNWGPGKGYSPVFQGAGLINIPAALASKDVVRGSAISPIVGRCANGNLCLQNTSVVWGDSVIWSDNVIWSDSVTTSGANSQGDDNDQGDNVVWSDSVIWCDNVIWSDNVLWADNVIWSDSVSGAGVTADQVVWADLSSTALLGD